MKKATALILALILVISLLAGCDTKPAETTAPPASTTAPTAAATTAPATTEPTEPAYPEEISIFATFSARCEAAGMKDYNDTYWAQALEALTGTHVDWKLHSADVGPEKFTLMIASEQYPDAIVYNWQKAEGGIELYHEDEIIIDLAELIPECMPNLNAYLEANPDVKKTMTNGDGKILSIPTIREQQALNIFVGPQIRTDWLKKLELEVPTTTEELYEVLKAFKTQDPNGNGEADEIPMSGVGFDSTTFGIGNLLWAFGTHYSFYVKDGQVVWGPAEDNFTDGLAYIAKLYDEGLIDVDYLLNDRTAMDSKAIADRVGFEYSYQPTKYYNSADFNDGNRVMSGIHYLTSADNDSMACYNQAYTQSVVTTVALAVTTACEDPEGLLRWLDTVYSEEGILAMNYGEENKHYTIVNGEPQIVADLDLTDHQATTMIVNATFPILQQWGAYSSTLSPWGAEAIATWADGVDTSGVLPTLALTAEETEQIADALTQIQTYAQTEMNNVVIGETSIEEWPEIVEKFRNMGLEDVLAVYNAAYARYLAK